MLAGSTTIIKLRNLPRLRVRRSPLAFTLLLWRISQVQRSYFLLHSAAQLFPNAFSINSILVVLVLSMVAVAFFTFHVLSVMSLAILIVCFNTNTVRTSCPFLVLFNMRGCFD